MGVAAAPKTGAEWARRAYEGTAVAYDDFTADYEDETWIADLLLVWALDDTINYLLSAEELRQALVGMRENLAPPRLLLFDANTLLAYRTFFAETTVVERQGRRLVWRGLTAPQVEVLAAMELAGLECLDTYGIYTDGVRKQPLDESIHTKAIYVARRARPRG